MNGPIDYQIIMDKDKPIFVLVPYEEFLELAKNHNAQSTIPHEVVERHILDGKNMVRSWREFKGLSQKEVARRMHISQSAYSQMEKAKHRLRKSTLKRISAALELKPGQLDI